MKNKGKIALKYLFKISLSALIVVYLFLAPVLIFPVLKQSQSSINQEIQVDYMGILEMWNIDTFEGGSKSRTLYLENCAIEVEKKSVGTFIMCTNMTVEQAVLNIQSGKLPDLVSFGIGMGEKLINYLIPLSSTYGVRDDLVEGGMCNKLQYAIPYILGGYTLISDTDYQLDETKKINGNVGVGLGDYTSPLLALAVNDIEINSQFEQNDNIDSFTAYDKFLDKKFDTLLGTQRDLYRVKNRIDKGNMMPKNYHYFSGFSDLVQYVGICSKDPVKQEIAQKFIDHLLSNNSQQKISDMNMFSVKLDNLYLGDEYEIYEKALSKPLKTLNVFLSQEKLKEIKVLSKKALSGDKLAKQELEKYLV